MIEGRKKRKHDVRIERKRRAKKGKKRSTIVKRAEKHVEIVFSVCSFVPRAFSATRPPHVRWPGTHWRVYPQAPYWQQREDVEVCKSTGARLKVWTHTSDNGGKCKPELGKRESHGPVLVLNN